jgi:hypothetical protein
MGYKELLAKNLIRPFKAKDQQIRNQMELASRDLKTAKANLKADLIYSRFLLAMLALPQ